MSLGLLHFVCVFVCVCVCVCVSLIVSVMLIFVKVAIEKKIYYKLPMISIFLVILYKKVSS